MTLSEELRDQPVVGSPFLARLMAGLLGDAHTTVTGQRDYDRFPASTATRWRDRWNDLVRSAGARCGWARPDRSRGKVKRELEIVLLQLGKLGWLYDHLADAESRDLLLCLLRFRIWGQGHVELPLHEPGYWVMRNGATDAAIRRGVDRVGSWVFDEFEKTGRSGKVRVVLPPLGFITTFELEHYALRRAGVDISSRPRDVVLDGGGCWGDTALYFADAVGAEGKVYCFEFEEANLRRLEANLARNPELACRVQVVRRPMWSTPGQELRYDPMGPGTTVKPEGSPTARSVLTQSIDGLVREEGLAAVDFIKMDIEGAEMEALRGAEQTLRTFKPDLALSIYHSLEDYHRLAYFLEGLGLGYRFYLRHLTVHLEETVLFASARAHPSSHAHA